MVLVSMGIFSRCLNPAVSVETSDTPVSVSMQFVDVLKHWTRGCDPLQGLPILVGDITTFLYLIIPVAKMQEMLMILSVLAASFFLYLFFRERGYSRIAALVGGIALGFSTELISLAKAGHTGKFLGVGYMTVALWMMGRVISGRAGWLTASFAGLFVGWSLAEGRDFSFLVGLAIGAFWIKELVLVLRERRSAGVKLAIQFMIAGIMAIVSAFPVFKVLERQVTVHKPAKQQWEEKTQWSLPPKEIIKLICVSYYGWDSWDQKAPYHGEMGRSEGWEKTRQGFRNFTQTNEYVGVIVFILAVIGLWRFGMAGRISGVPGVADFVARVDSIFWACVTLAGLLLAFGKYSPVYGLFYSIPTMDSIRCPVKFMQVVCFGLAILSAQGVRALEEVIDSEVSFRKRLGMPLLIVTGAVVLLFFFLLLVAPWNSEVLVTRLRMEGYSPQVGGIQSAMLLGVLRSFALSSIVLGIMVYSLSKWCGPSARGKILAGSLLIVLLAVDFITTGRKYVTYYDWSKVYQPNCLIGYLENSKEYRAKFIPPNWGIFSYWNNLLVPISSIRVADSPYSPERTEDEAKLEEAFRAQPSKMWKLLGVKHYVMPRELCEQFTQLMGRKVTEAKGFDIVPAEGCPGLPVWSQVPGGGRFVVLEDPDVLPCASWYGKAEWLSRDAAVRRLADAGFSISDTLILDDAVQTERRIIGGAASGRRDCEVVRYSKRDIEIRCRSEQNGWVLVNDYYDTRWKAKVNGRDVPIVRANGVFRAVEVPAGDSKIEMSLYANNRSFVVPMACFIALVCAGLVSIVVRRFVQNNGGARSNAKVVQAAN